MELQLISWQHTPVGPELREFLGWPEPDAMPSPLTEEDANRFSNDLMNLFEQHKAQSFEQFLDIAEELVLMRLPAAALHWFDCNGHLPWQTFPRALLHHGSAAMMANQFNKAEDAFRKCQALAPSEIASYVNLAQILYREHRDEEAKQWCEAGLGVDPNNETLWEILGGMLRHQSATDQDCGRQLLAEAEQRQSWAGTSLAALYIDSNDHLYRAQLLEDLYSKGLRDNRFLIELTAALGVAQQYEKIPALVWQAQKLTDDATLPWQLAAHAGQAELGQEHTAQALHWFEMALRSTGVPRAAASELEALCDEIRSGANQIH
jgi:tetratricopeptide (TPR) repeat protein